MKEEEKVKWHSHISGVFERKVQTPATEKKFKSTQTGELIKTTDQLINQSINRRELSSEVLETVAVSHKDQVDIRPVKVVH